ncbi:MAG: hypothetical protein P8O70_17470 [SAR324 cluster bacterium]|nr:hypothetical protein [SAR324 cluster bacterium]
MMSKVVISQLQKRRQRRYSTIGVESFIPRFEEQLAYPSFDRVLPSMFRCGTLADQGMVYRNCGSLKGCGQALALGRRRSRCFEARCCADQRSDWSSSNGNNAGCGAQFFHYPS